MVPNLPFLLHRWLHPRRMKWTFDPITFPTNEVQLRERELVRVKIAKNGN
jgi:hypothetical protein